MRHRVAALLLVPFILCAREVHAQTAAAAVPVVADEVAFFATVRENLVRAQRAAPLFYYKERRTKLHLNPFGRLGTDGVELFHVYPSARPRLTYRRLVARNGLDLPREELDKQDREYRRRAARARRRMQQETAADRRRRLDEEARERKRAQELIDDIMSAIDLSVTGRALHDGQPAITAAFAGKPAARPKTRQGRIAQKLAGNVWIHADQLEVMYVSATATGDVAFGFGLVATLSKGTAGSLTREPITEDVWMPTNLRLAGHGDALLHLRSLEIDYAIDWFDYLPHDGSIPGID